jgi:hypothetical protein
LWEGKKMGYINVETIVRGRRAGDGEEENKEEKIILYEYIQIYYI